MPTKQDGKWVKQSIAITRQAVANAQKRRIPTFKHPPKGKPPKPASAADEPPAEAPTEAASGKSEPDEG